MKGKTRSHLTFCLTLVFTVVASLNKEDCQKFSGMLNVLPYMGAVKREIPYLVAQKW